ncbi:MAG TPA: hypothetical protein VHZ32_17235 [Rhizomicrobium sp.]|nr:hypothetical protein [Rhizomicrobium sp.]
MQDGIAIAISSGGFRGVFAQGVLSAFEGRIAADAFGCASSSVVSGTLAAIGRSRSHGLDYWQRAAAKSETMGMSDVILTSIAEHDPDIRAAAFRPGSPRLLIAVSRVTTPEAAAKTQSDGAKRLGRKLLIQAARGDTSWVDTNLAKEIFDTAATGNRKLDAGNSDQVSYASTRMLHEWDIPAEIDGEPYIDASYTCSCPVFDLVERGYRDVIVIDPSPGDIYDSIFRQRLVRDGEQDGSRIHLIKPAIDTKDIGVDYTKATRQGIQDGYDLGVKAGDAFLAGFLSR